MYITTADPATQTPAQQAFHDYSSADYPLVDAAVLTDDIDEDDDLEADDDAGIGIEIDPECLLPTPQMTDDERTAWRQRATPTPEELAAINEYFDRMECAPQVIDEIVALIDSLDDTRKTEDVVRIREMVRRADRMAA